MHRVKKRTREKSTCRCYGTLFCQADQYQQYLYNQPPPQVLGCMWFYILCESSNSNKRQSRRKVSMDQCIWYCKWLSSYRTKQGSLRPLTMHSGSYLSFFLNCHDDCTYFIPACVFLISQYGESVSIISRSRGIPFTMSRFSAVLREQPFRPRKNEKQMIG